ncbi:hypothetical protein HWV62_18940 [Athelia sp. TMB]|nr:hypothetical protein HWV62_18940 [Athelia sp. TMB]
MLPYTGSEILDGALCRPVAAFHALLDPPSNLPFNVDLLFGFGTLVLGLAVESARVERSALVGLYVAIVMVAQFATAAVMLPVYWLIFVLSGAAKRTASSGSGVDQAHAESVVFGIFTGYALPSLAMLLMDNPYATAFWQPFPLWIFLAQHAYLAIRPRAGSAKSGYMTIQSAYTAVFLTAGVSHMYYAAPMLLAGEFAAYSAQLTPDLAIDASSTVQAASLGLLQWDILFVQLSTLCACLWTAQSTTEFVGIIGWLAVGAVTVGPAASVAAIFAHRERKLNGQAVIVSKKDKRN